MSPPVSTEPARVPDQDQRDAAVRERKRNVLVDAGAGTGKTTLLVSRLVNLVAPDDGSPPIPIGRIAAVTFTRRAAGELRLRIRERVLRALADPSLSAARRDALHDALSGLDTSYVGTIHSFADRLLRLRPMEARLSPGYEVVDDEGDLSRETFTLLLDACETGRLADVLGSDPSATRAAESIETVLDALRTGVRAESLELEYWKKHGLSGLVSEFIRRRDTPPADPMLPGVDLAAFRAYAGEFIRLARRLSGEFPGVRWMKRVAQRLDRLGKEEDPVIVYREAVDALSRGPADATKKRGFGDDDAAWNAWKAVDGDSRQKPVRDRPLREDILGPLQQWMAYRLVRLFPVVVALYERVKARHRALDQVDLLLKLRNLLAEKKEIRGHYQSLFDHIFVDEFQDTDPLQAEIVLYLCEREPRARQWQDVQLADGKLTLVGDPKQSIYRFRRADIAMYDQVRRIVAARPHLNVELSVNFRSAGPLISWFNDRFAELLGTPTIKGQLFNPDAGEVFHQPLRSCRSDSNAPRVHVVPFEGEDDANAGDYRALEAEVLARYLRWLVEVRQFQVTDPLTGKQRRVAYGDIAVLAIVTTTLAPLFTELDRMGVPYAARGGTLFLADELHRQFLLGLRAIADRDDGIAEAALLRPPFFAVDLVDLVQHRAGDGDPARLERTGAAVEFVRELRRRRFERSPGATARDLLEQTAFGRAVALGPNGMQRLERLREICLILEQTAATEGLDYDAATARMRDWVTAPVQLDPPHPIGAAAVQVMTVHQAKGLEFPVVVLWDGRALLAGRNDNTAWSVERNGRGWVLALDGLNWEEPPGLALRDTEKRYGDAERKRVVYVAATRARDLLVVPKAGAPDARHICGRLLANTNPSLTEELKAYQTGKGVRWANAIKEPAPPKLTDAAVLEAEILARWEPAVRDVAQPRYEPAGVAGEAELSPDDEGAEGAPTSNKRVGRYGREFGDTVHRAIGLAMRDPSLSAARAVRSAAMRTGLQEHFDEAAADVTRALDALRQHGLLRRLGTDLQLEYPVAGAGQGGKLLVGYTDLVSVTAERLEIIDFKTDQPPPGQVGQTYPEYVAQVRTYAQLLDTAGVRGERELRCGLLYTADGVIRWV